MLNFGEGGVLSNVISEAPSCKEIVFAEFREDNQHEVRFWLSKDPSAFQWQSFIFYVVCTLEEGMEKAVDERKELLRNNIKVVPCDIFQPEPVEDQGPFDIILTAFCLENVSTTNKEYTEGIAKQAHLVKPGGTLLMLSLENYCSCNKGDMVETYTFDPYSRKFVGFLFSKFFSPPCTQISAATTPQSFKICSACVELASFNTCTGRVCVHISKQAR